MSEESMTPAQYCFSLLHGLDPFNHGLTELLDSLLLLVHRTGFPAICRLEVPVSYSSLAFLLRLPDHFDWHTELSLPGLDSSKLICDSGLTTVNDDIGKDERESF